MSSSGTYCVQRKHVPMDRRPRMLKDFLVDDSNSCSSSGFKSFRRKACDLSIQTLIEIDLNARKANSSSNIIQLIRNRSKPASTTFSTIQAMINAVKNIPFTAVKSHSILPRSLSRRLSSKQSRRRKGENKEHEAKIKVTIKDIIKWQSFQGLVDEQSPPSDSASSPHHGTTTATTGSTASTTPSPCNSSGSSWCDSDFSSDSEYLPCWSGKKNLPFVGEDNSMEATAEMRTTYVSEGAKGEEYQQYSPVSVIDFEFEEEDENTSYQCLIASAERTRHEFGGFEGLAKLDPVNLEKWMNLITSPENDDNEEEEEEEEEERGKETTTSYGGEDDNKEEETNYEIEEKAWQLLNHVKATSSMGSCKNNVDQVLLDFFRHELLVSKRFDKQNGEFDSDETFINRAKAWIDEEEDKQCIKGWGVEHNKKEACVREMDKEGRWSKFEQEEEELVLEIENGVLGHLIDELLLKRIS